MKEFLRDKIACAVVFPIITDFVFEYNNYWNLFKMFWLL